MRTTYMVAITFMIFVDILAFVWNGAMAVAAVEAQSNLTFPQLNVLNQYSDPTKLDGQDVPNVDRGIGATVAGWFSDMFNTIKSWLGSAIIGTLSVVTAIPVLLVNSGLPSEIAVMLAAMWHGFTIVLIGLLMTGR